MTASPLFETTIRDWRFADGSQEDLTGSQTKDWTVRVETGPYKGLSLFFVAPHGSERIVEVEIDKGNVTLGTYRAGEGDQDVKVFVATDATYVRPGENTGPLGEKITRYDQDGGKIHEGEIPEGFAE